MNPESTVSTDSTREMEMSSWWREKGGGDHLCSNWRWYYKVLWGVLLSAWLVHARVLSMWGMSAQMGRKKT